MCHVLSLRQLDAALPVTKLHGRFPFCCVGWEKAVACLFALVFCGWFLVSVENGEWCSPDLTCGRGSFDPSVFTIGVSARVFPYQAYRHSMMSSVTSLARAAG